MIAFLLCLYLLPGVAWLYFIRGRHESAAATLAKDYNIPDWLALTILSAAKLPLWPTTLPKSEK